MLHKDFHAHDADAFHSDYDGPSTDYTCGHSSPDMESPVGSQAAYNVLVSQAPTALRVVDVDANISIEANRFVFIADNYTKLCTPIHVKGIDVDIRGYGLVELHRAYQDGHTRQLHIRAAHAPDMPKRDGPSIISHEFLRKRHSTSFHYHAIGQPTANDSHESFILTMHNNLAHLHTPPGEFTSLLIDNKGVGPTYIGTILWQQRFGHPSKDAMTLALWSADITRAKYDNHVPVLSYEPCILAKLHHAVVITRPGTKATAWFEAFSSDTFGPLK
jgi:hypothetical protein